MLQQFLQLPLTIDFSASKHNCFDNSKYNEINNMHWLHPPHFVLQFPFPLGSHFPPPLTTRYTIVSTFHVAIPIATRFTFPTAIDYSNQQTQRHSQFMSHFPLPLVHYCLTHKYNTLHNSLHSSCWISHCHYVQFSTLPLTTRYTTASTFRVAFPTAIN